MLSKAVKFFQVISNELSYAEQVASQWSELEQVSKALSRAVEERNEYKERYESEQGYINYLQGAYRSASEQRTELETENEQLREQIKILKTENQKLKKSSESAEFQKSENKKLLGTAQLLFLRFYELQKEVEVLKAENEKMKDWDAAYMSLLKDYYEVFDRQREFKRIFTSVMSSKSLEV